MSEEGDATPRGAGGRVHPSLAAATTDPGAVRHGYNLRPKRKATQVADPLGDAVRTVIAPGEGEEANHRRVGGRDARAETDDDAGSEGSGALGERARATQGRRQSSLPLQESEDPAELEAQSTRLIAQLQKFIQEKEWALSSPANEPFICGDRLASGGAKARVGGRHGPQAHLFGNAAAKPGRLSSEEAALGGSRAVRHFSDKT